MKVALLGRDWEDDEREFISENLGEIVPSVMSSGSDVIVGMSKLPGGSKYFVIERCFDRRRRRTWTRRLLLRCERGLRFKKHLIFVNNPGSSRRSASNPLRCRKRCCLVRLPIDSYLVSMPFASPPFL